MDHATGAWIWTTSSQAMDIFFEDWGPNEPTGDGICVNYWPGANGWNDIGCSYRSRYFCEFAWLSRNDVEQSEMML